MFKNLSSVFVLLLIVFLAAQPAIAAGDGVSVQFHCESVSAIRFTVVVPGSVTALTLSNPFYPTLPMQFVVWPDDPAPKNFRSEYPRGTRYFYVQSNVGGQSFSYQVNVPANLSNCGEVHNPSPLPVGRECLAIPYPGSGYFVVDGNSYFYHNSLSFVVPLDAIWRWELYIDGVLILVFEQTAPGNCRITEDYRD